MSFVVPYTVALLSPNIHRLQYSTEYYEWNSCFPVTGTQFKNQGFFLIYFFCKIQQLVKTALGFLIHVFTYYGNSTFMYNFKGVHLF